MKFFYDNLKILCKQSYISDTTILKNRKILINQDKQRLVQSKKLRKHRIIKLNILSTNISKVLSGVHLVAVQLFGAL